jgi:uridine kinase
VWLCPQIPIYDFKSSKRVGYNTLEVPESRVVIIEGIYALSERLKPLLDLRVSITGGRRRGVGVVCHVGPADFRTL